MTRSNGRAPKKASEQSTEIPGLATRQAAATVLARVINDGRGLDGLLDSRHGPAVLRPLDAPDIGLVRAIVTTACRHRGEINIAIDKLMSRKPPKNARHLLHTLHVAAAQILFLDIPDSAAVNLAVTSLKADKRSTRFASLGNAVLRRMAREKSTLLAAQSNDGRARLNMPDWLFRDLRKGYGKDRTQAIAAAHMHEPVIDLTVKSDPAKWARKLGGVPLFGNSIRVPSQGSIADWEGYRDGAWWVQDAAASLPATMFGDIADKRVADLCASPGGKTAQLAAAGAHVTAVENSTPRLERLKSNLDRLKLQAECIDADILKWEPEKPFDAILLDAPCSATGTIRRHPDVQWTKSPEIVTELAALQTRMLLHAATFLKPGGTLVFANCSINRAEGEDIIARTDLTAAALTLDPVTADELPGLENCITGQGTVRTLPFHLDEIDAPVGSDVGPVRMQGLDGFFVARFRNA
ncbi:MAG: RsmB/NOP family class I SAM-dependent RNA methyltransferase [Rhizobiaceae bacterium]